MRARIFIILFFFILLAGCSQKSKVIKDEIIISNFDSSRTTTKNAEAKLAEAAVAVSGSLQQLAEIERATQPTAKIPPPPNPAIIGMAELASVNWVGPVEPLVRKIAKATNYKVRVLGRRPTIPAIVAINSKNVPLADILRNVSFQAQKKVAIYVYPRKKVIELRYRRMG